MAQALDKKTKLLNVFQTDMCLASSFLKNDNFYEGVDKALISKTKDPKWTHKSINDVT